MDMLQIATCEPSFTSKCTFIIGRSVYRTTEFPMPGLPFLHIYLPFVRYIEQTDRNTLERSRLIFNWHRHMKKDQGHLVSGHKTADSFWIKRLAYESQCEVSESVASAYSGVSYAPKACDTPLSLSAEALIVQIKSIYNFAWLIVGNFCSIRFLIWFTHIHTICYMRTNYIHQAI